MTDEVNYGWSLKTSVPRRKKCTTSQISFMKNVVLLKQGLMNNE